MKTSNRKINPGHYIYNGYEIERMEEGHWNMKPIGESDWTDSEDTLKWAKEMVDVYNRNNAELKLSRI